MNPVSDLAAAAPAASGLPISPHTATFDQRVELDRIRLFFGLAKGNMVSMLFGLVALGALLLHSGVAGEWLLGWFALFCVSFAGVLRFERQVHQMGITLENCARLLRQRVALGVWMASFYGLGALLLPINAPSMADTLLFIMLTTVVSTGALSFAIMPVHYLSIAATCFVPLGARFIYRYINQHDDMFGLLFLLALGWLAVVLNKTRSMSHTSREAIALNRRLHDEIEGHEQTRETLRQLALTDPLTGLGNRRHFDAVLARTLALAEREGARFGVLAIDLDNFKPVNDRFGHPVGDALLKLVARRLQTTVRAGDFCARMGGDEFAVIVHPIGNLSDMQAVGHKVRVSLEQAHPFNPGGAPSSASVGWSVYPDDSVDATGLTAVADSRMYLNKHGGKLATLKLPEDARRPG
jgi:diguanylate cyclase (GGDEF)-like protein